MRKFESKVLKTLGEVQGNFARVREQSGWSQRKVAAYLECSLNTVVNFEARKDVRLSTVEYFEILYREFLLAIKDAQGGTYHGNIHLALAHRHGELESFSEVPDAEEVELPVGA